MRQSIKSPRRCIFISRGPRHSGLSQLFTEQTSLKVHIQAKVQVGIARNILP